jgi:hypothetical protein
MKASNWPSGLLIGTYFPARRFSSKLKVHGKNETNSVSEHVEPVTSKNGTTL